MQGTELKTLNLGCGDSRITGAVNVDMSEKVSPDVCFDIRQPFPLDNDTFEEVYFFHCIEHIEKRKHDFVLSEIWRVMEMGAMLYISYPEFSSIVSCWLHNYENKRDFWEATIFGRRLYPGDEHVCAVDRLELKEKLFNCGFNVLREFSEPSQPFNTVLWCEKVNKPITYEEVLYKELFVK